MRRYPDRTYAAAVCLVMFYAAVQFFGCSGRKDRIAAAFQTCRSSYALYVSKDDFSLSVFNRKLDMVEKFTIGYGSNPDRKPKLHAGDRRTPEGLYHINEILSIDINKGSSAYKKLAGMNRTYFSAKEGHSKYGRPDVDLGYNAFGPRYFGLDYPNEKDRERYRLRVKNGTMKKGGDEFPGIGSGIAIHGNADEVSIGQLSSNGCIRMFNSDIVRLEAYIQIGTPVIISSESN